MYKVVINCCYGGFDLSKKAEELYFQKTGKQFNEWTGSRHDPALVAVVEELTSKEASNEYSRLNIVEVKGLYRITEYDGFESIETPEDLDWIDPTK